MLHPCRSSSFPQTPTRQEHDDLLDSFPSLKIKANQQKVSPAMSSLQCYYGLNSLSPQESPESHNSKPLSSHRKSRSLNKLNDNEESENIDEGDVEKWNETPVRRRLKFESESIPCPPEKILREDSNNNATAFSASKGQGLALRSKVASRSTMSSELENSILPNGITRTSDALMLEAVLGVRKSLSTPSFQDQETSNSLSLWSTSRWSLKQDLQAFSTAVIATPIFDGLPIQLNSRKTKTALD